MFLHLRGGVRRLRRFPRMGRVRKVGRTRAPPDFCVSNGEFCITLGADDRYHRRRVPCCRRDDPSSVAPGLAAGSGVQGFVEFYGSMLLWAAGAVLLGGLVRFPDREAGLGWVVHHVPAVRAAGGGVGRNPPAGRNRESRSGGPPLRIDRLAATHDRFHTALVLAGRSPAERTPFEGMALAECVRFVEAFDFRRVIPIRSPWKAWWVPVPLIAYVTLALYGLLGIGQPPARPGARRRRDPAAPTHWRRSPTACAGTRLPASPNSTRSPTR